MEKKDKRVVTLDRYEHGVIVNALNDKRNDLLEEKRPTDIVDEVLLKVIDLRFQATRSRRLHLKSCRSEISTSSKHATILTLHTLCPPETASV